MKTVLHIQSDSTDKADTFIIDDGEPMPYSDGIAEHVEAARLLNEATDWMKLSLPGNKNIRCYRSNKGTYIQSNYQNKDVVGRRIAFRFYTDSKSLDTACKILKDMSRKVNRQCDDIELSSLNLRDKSVNKDSFLFYQDTLIDGNGKIISSVNPEYQSMMSKFEQNGKNFKLENGFYFLKENNSLRGKVEQGFAKVMSVFTSNKNADNDKIYFIQSVFDDTFKFWIEAPKSIDDTINHLTNLSKYFEKQVSDSDLKTLKSKSNYGE